MDPAVHALQYLDVIQMKDTTHKSHFYHSLKGALASIPKVRFTSLSLISSEVILTCLSVGISTILKVLFLRRNKGSKEEFQSRMY